MWCPVSERSRRFREGPWKLQDLWRKEAVNEAGEERHNVKRVSECECRFTSRHLIRCAGEDPPHPPVTGKRRWVAGMAIADGPKASLSPVTHGESRAPPLGSYK